LAISSKPLAMMPPGVVVSSSKNSNKLALNTVAGIVSGADGDHL
jgi:hypothetical protein